MPCSPKGSPMTDEELEQQDKQEQKEERQEERKKTLKTVITSVICTLLFVLTLLLITILCLKNCSNRNNNGDTSSSSSEPEPTESYSTSNLNDVFKHIMDAAFVDYVVDDTTSEIYAVTCTDNKDVDNTFQLDISAKGSGNNFYTFSVPDARYENNTDNKALIPYLLSLPNLDREQEVQKYFLDGTISFSTGIVTNETKEAPSSSNKYVITKPTETSDIRYLSGYYKDDSGYHAFTKKQIEGSQNPFSSGDSLIDKEHLLYDYYHFFLDK